MKKSFIFVVFSFFFLLTTVSYSQCFHGISTDPMNPKNEQFYYHLSSSGLGGSLSTNVFLNTFDWGYIFPNTTDFAKIQLNPLAGFSSVYNSITNWEMINPFSDDMGQEYSYLHNSPFLNERDFHWEDGWELLTMNLGFYPNGIPITDDVTGLLQGHNTPNGEFPYMILYNRYRGIIRVFFNTRTGLNNNFDHAEIRLGFITGLGAPVSGLFMSTQDFFKPLSKSTDALFVIGMNKHPNNPSKWMSTDFQIAYDPCTCRNSSKLTWRITLFKESDIELQTRSTDIEIALSQNGEPNYNADFLTNFTAENKIGEVIYKKMDYLFDDYTSRYNNYAMELNRYEAYNSNIKVQILNAGKSLVVDGVLSTIPGGAIADWLLKNGLDFGSEKKDLEKNIQVGAKTILSQGYDMLSAELVGVKPGKPRVPSMPVATIREGVIAGNNTERTDLQGSTFYNPGTYSKGHLGYDLTSHSQSLGSLTESNYPVYNEVLGTFALLNYPELITTRDIEVTDVWGYSFPNGFYGTMAQLNFQKSLKLENINYAFNSALDLDMEKTRVYVQLEFEVDNDMHFDSHFKDHRTYVYTQTDVNGPNMPDFEMGYKNIGDPNNGLSQYLSSFPLMINGQLQDRVYYPETLIMLTPLIPIDALGNCNFQFSGDPETRFFYDQNRSQSQMEQIVSDYFKLEIKNVKIKFLVDFYYNQIGSNGEQVNITQVFTYQLPTVYEKINEIYNYQHDYSAEFIGDKTFGNTIFNASHPDVYQVVGNTLYVAASSIHINGNIGVVTGKTLVLQYLNQINVNPNSEIDENIIMELYTAHYTPVPIEPKMNDTFFDSYCNNENSYRANAASKRGLDSIKGTEESNLEPDKNNFNNYSLHPNPSTNQTILSISNSVGGEYTIWVTDMAGKIVLTMPSFQLEQIESENIQIQTDLLKNGVYFISVKNGGTIQSQKLVVLR